MVFGVQVGEGLEKQKENIKENNSFVFNECIKHEDVL